MTLREPVAMAPTRQVRVEVSVLTNNDFISSLFDYVDTLLNEIRVFAQSTLFTVESHGVDGEL